eukprot:6474336-Prymnesium_polylepis.1
MATAPCGGGRHRRSGTRRHLCDGNGCGPGAPAADAGSSCHGWLPGARSHALAVGDRRVRVCAALLPTLLLRWRR